MTFEEYKQAMSKLGFTVERGGISNTSVKVTDDKGQILTSFNTVDSLYLNKIDGSTMSDFSINQITYLFDQTKKFLNTPYSKRGLDTYELVLQRLHNMNIVIGVQYFDPDHTLYDWRVGLEEELKSKGYQYKFTDKELADLTNKHKELADLTKIADSGTDDFLAGRLNALKERI